MRGQAAASPQLHHGVAVAIAPSAARLALMRVSQPGKGTASAASTATSDSPQADSTCSRCATSPMLRWRRV
jgi:hypothetical protein